MLPEALSDHPADSGYVVGAASGGKCCRGFAAVDGGRVRVAGGSGPAGGMKPVFGFLFLVLRFLIPSGSGAACQVGSGERQLTDALSGGGEDGVAESGNKGRHAGFADAGGRSI